MFRSIGIHKDTNSRPDQNNRVEGLLKNSTCNILTVDIKNRQTISVWFGSFIHLKECLSLYLSIDPFLFLYIICIVQSVEWHHNRH
jgi:hypothetical protein